MIGKNRLFIMLMLAFVISIMITGCDGLFEGEGINGLFHPKDDTDYYSEEVLGFTLPEGASIRDFDWFFDSRSYDDSSEEPLSDPYDVAGIWEMALWRKPDAKSGAQKEVYWINIELKDSNRTGFPGTSKMDPSDAAELYAYNAFLDSEEAKKLGIARSEASQNLLDALSEGDGSVAAKVTMIQVGVEDSDGVWSDVDNAKPMQFEGKYYPEAMLLKIKDPKGNEISANHFLTADDGQHAIGAYFPAKFEPMLNGSVVLYRSSDK